MGGVHHVVAKLDALDPDAGAAVRVIARFDQLIEGRAGLEPILAAVASLAGCPARLDRPGVTLRVDGSGAVERGVGPADPRWPVTGLTPDGPPALWLERPGPYSLVDAMVLDRAAFAIREVLHRTRRAPADPAALEVLLDGTASAADRLHAAHLLHLPPKATPRAVAVAGQPGRVEVGDRWEGTGRTGIGPAVPVLELPRSWALARVALRFAAEDTDDDPGPSLVRADEIGSLMLLAEAFDPAAPPADVRTLESAAKSAPWVLRTLVAFTSHASLRLAAAALFVHHSTLQDRLAAIEHELGWRVRDPQGRLRVQLAIALRRLALHPVGG